MKRAAAWAQRSLGPDRETSIRPRRPEVGRLRREGYAPAAFIERSPDLAEVLALIESGFFSLGDPDRFRPIVNSLRHLDRYLVCADYDDFVATEERTAEAFRDPVDWSRRSLHNIAGASRFSSDETIRQYADEIWKLTRSPSTSACWNPSTSADARAPWRASFRPQSRPRPRP